MQDTHSTQHTTVAQQWVETMIHLQRAYEHMYRYTQHAQTESDKEQCEQVRQHINSAINALASSSLTIPVA